jgi:hypothetical protein
LRQGLLPFDLRHLKKIPASAGKPRQGIGLIRLRIDDAGELAEDAIFSAVVAGAVCAAIPLS